MYSKPDISQETVLQVATATLGEEETSGGSRKHAMAVAKYVTFILFLSWLVVFVFLMFFFCTNKYNSQFHHILTFIPSSLFFQVGHISRDCPNGNTGGGGGGNNYNSGGGGGGAARNCYNCGQVRLSSLLIFVLTTYCILYLCYILAYPELSK